MSASSEAFDSERLQAYFAAGERRAAELDNRGPLRYTRDGNVHPEILEAFHRVGIYIFEGLISPEELAELKADLLDVVDHLPAENGSPVDRHGGPAVGVGLDPPVVAWSKPLSDPLGGRDVLRNRHPVKMIEAEPARDAPREVPLVISGILQFSDAALRVYGHPDLLSIAAAIHGEDFVPQNEALIMKQPGLGAAFPWHQDGMTHWDSPEWDPEIHGFHFMVQLFGSTAANGMWYLPGSHRKGRADIKGLIEKAGGNLLPDAVPLISKPGDVAVNNRQLVHASFPNTSKDVRMTLNLGFHRRKAVEGARGLAPGTNVERTYDAEAIRRRSEILGFAIDARRQHFPNERPFLYRPQSGTKFSWSEASRAAIRHYNRSDLLI